MKKIDSNQQQVLLYSVSVGITSRNPQEALAILTSVRKLVSESKNTWISQVSSSTKKSTASIAAVDVGFSKSVDSLVSTEKPEDDEEEDHEDGDCKSE